MFKPFLCIARATVAIAAATVVLSAAPAVAEDAPPPALTPEQTAQARKMMGPTITEKDYAAYLKLLTAVQTCDMKMQNAKDDAAKAEIQKTKDDAFVAAGMDAQTYQKMGQEINMLKTILNAAALRNDNAKNPQNMQQALQMFDPVSVVTVKAHLQDNGAAATAGPTSGPTPGTAPGTVPNGAPAAGTGADTAAAAPAAALPAETEVDTAKLPGTWAYDMDTTLELIKPGMPANQKQMMMNMMKGHVHIVRVVIGPGNASTAFTQNPDGTESKSTGTWTYANKQITIKHDDATQKDDVLDVAMRGEFLMVGKGQQKAAFKRKTE